MGDGAFFFAICEDDILLFMKQKRIIAGNWKLYPDSFEEARTIFLAVRKATEKNKHIQSIVCPPFLYTRDAARLFVNRKRLAIGAQNCSIEDRGAYTGEISAVQLSYSGVSYVIVGHSERRAMGETDDTINKKVQAVLRAGLRVILCVGEKERDEQGHYLAFVEQQLTSALHGVGATDLSHIIVAYEPVWAIGKPSREAMAPQQLHEMAIFVRKIISQQYGTKLAFATPILYGGSVGPDNAASFFEAGVDGLLIGRASADPQAIVSIIESL